MRRKWERKFGLFIALPVASDLESAQVHMVSTAKLCLDLTYFERGRNDSRSEVFLVGGGVANKSIGGGELT